jgi:acyl dehydratase
MANIVRVRPGTYKGWKGCTPPTEPPSWRRSLQEGIRAVSIAQPAEHRVVAFNSAKTSENKIHDDAVARQYGFAGGLVPGVDVYAYMTHAAVALWGRDWLERGWMAARFLKPVYEGEEVTVQAAPAAENGIEIAAQSRGEACGLGTARLPAIPPSPPSPAEFPHLPLPDPKPPASTEALPAGRVLGAYDCVHTAADAEAYLQNVRETLPLYADAGLVHPGFLLRLGNWVLRENVHLGPWIHVSSEVQNFAAVPLGQKLSARGRVLDTFERKGHKFVELDVAAFCGERPALRIRHTAIYAPRRAAG